ncbi:MAG: YncE family protein [Acidobacteriaceae bacterium]|nr:YncE family protein [Acidobacteriaceae bacterium]
MFRVSSTPFVRSCAARTGLVASATLSMLLAGCGAQYRPVVTSTGPSAPGGQPTKYAVVISDPDPTNASSTTPGLATIVDFSGDTVITSPQIQAKPNYVVTNSAGTQAFITSNAGNFSEFSTSNPNTLISSNVVYSTLDSTALPVNLSAFALSNSTASVFVPEPGKQMIAALTSAGQLVREVAMPSTPSYIVGTDSGLRMYVLNTNGDENGTASAVESSSTAGLSVTGTITVGKDPVYGVMTSDAKRAFVMNKGSQSVSVINAATNALDVTMPTITIPTVTDSSGNNLSQNPVWADLNPTTNILAVLSEGDGTHGGLLTVISIPLCSTIAQPDNSTCDSTDPSDATGFGQVLATVPVGINPTMVQILRDTVTPRAYVANTGNDSSNGSVSVVNLTSNVVTATVPVQADSTTLSTSAIYGLHPTTLATSVGTPTGRVYITSPDSRYLTILYTDTDTVYTHVPIYGSGIRVVMTAR